jgi:hypothetical protein
MELKQCRNCGLEKPLGSFYKNNQQKDGKTIYCKDCIKLKNDRPEHRDNVRKAQLKKYYGITPEQYDNLYREQNGICKICEHSDTGGRRNYLCVDHDHETGKVRGLLCHDCNIGIGKLKDDPKLLQKAMLYLIQNKE